VKHHLNGYVSNRVLKLNVGFLLATGAGHQHQTTFDVPVVRVDNDVDLEYLRGTLRLTRTKEGILAQGTLHAGLAVECVRCLDDILRDVPIEVEELYAYPAAITSEYSIEEDGQLDLTPLLRAEALMADEDGILCREDCQGLCMECGANLNHETCDCGEDDIDPRFAALKALRDSQA
jgi:uncharacterized protein